MNPEKILLNYSRAYKMGHKEENSFSSSVYNIMYKEEKYILKIPYNERRFITETSVLSTLNQHDFSCPKLIEVLEKDKYHSFIMSFVKGKNGNDIELTNKTIKEMANKLIEFHRTQPPEGLLCHDASYLKATFEQNNKKIEACVGIAVCKVLKCYFLEHCSLINRQRFDALIHRDLRLGNMIFDDNNQMYLIDFESCAIGDPLMDLMKIYPTLKRRGQQFLHAFIYQYLDQTGTSRKELIEIVEFYIFLDKVNTVAWCLERNRTKDQYFLNSKEYLLQIAGGGNVL